jgi:uncharacterized membrane protein
MALPSRYSSGAMLADAQLEPHETALVHLYRGELARMTSYRVRLDTTTNWAVGTTAALVSFAFGNASRSHFIFGLALLLNVIFLWMEARRYTAYDIVRRRVRWLETGFYHRVLSGAPAHEDWRAELARSLAEPRSQVTQLQALSVRLARGYVWLISTVYVGWLVKLGQLGGLVEGATWGALPGEIGLLLAALPLLLAGVLCFYYRAPEQG